MLRAGKNKVPAGERPPWPTNCRLFVRAGRSGEITNTYTTMYIAIAGNIGSGKTTLTQILTKRYDAKCYLEECDNPYIGDFYEDMNRWAFNPISPPDFVPQAIQTMDMLL